MKNELMYAVLDYAPNVQAPEPLKNAGLYTGDVLFDKKPWGNNYAMPRTEPDAVAYSSHFYASHHIPSYNRPGNNSIDSREYKIYTINDSGSSGGDNRDNVYHFSCHT